MASYFQQVLSFPFVHFLVGVKFFSAEGRPAYWFRHFRNLRVRSPISYFCLVIIGSFHNISPILSKKMKKAGQVKRSDPTMLYLTIFP